MIKNYKISENNQNKIKNNAITLNTALLTPFLDNMYKTYFRDDKYTSNSEFTTEEKDVLWDEDGLKSVIADRTRIESRIFTKDPYKFELLNERN